jgi:hypothetical protein
MGLVWNIEPQCNGMTTSLLGSYRATNVQAPVTCGGGTFVGIQATYNAQVVQCIEFICNCMLHLFHFPTMFAHHFVTC